MFIINFLAKRRFNQFDVITYIFMTAFAVQGRWLAWGLTWFAGMVISLGAENISREES